MDYSIHDAIEARFNNVVFIIRKHIKKSSKRLLAIVLPLFAVARIIIHISKMKYGSKLCKWIL